MKRIFKIAGKITLILFMFVKLASSRTITVGTGLGYDYTIIQAAIDYANDGDTVLVRPGTYTGAGNRNIHFKGKAITVRSTDPNDPNIVAATIIDCQGDENQPRRGFHFHSGEGKYSVVAGLTITNGYGPNEDIFDVVPVGGAIFCEDSSPTIAMCRIENNRGLRGAGMCNSHCSPTVIDCVFSKNIYRPPPYGGGEGSGMFNWYSDPQVTGCTFSENLASHGGGMHNWGSSPTVTGCTFRRNTTSHSAAGMFNRDGASPTVTKCKFVENRTGSMGGGMFNIDGSNPLVVNCLFSLNSASDESGRGEGGGICNDSDFDGLAVDPTIANCTFAGNSAIQNGGGVCDRRSSNSTLINCIFWDNNDFGGMDESAQVHGVPIINYCCVQGLTGDLGGKGNIGADPEFTYPATGDYHLLPGSPCINTGDPDYVPAPAETDIDGNPRVMDGRIDMGADEFQITPKPIIGISSSEFRFDADMGGLNPKEQVLVIRNIGGGGTVYWSTLEDAPWLEVYPTNGESTKESDEVILIVDISGMNSGLHNAELIIVADGVVNSPRRISVTLHVYDNDGQLHVPSEYATIQSAIDEAFGGDTIIVEPGTYNENINFKGKNVNLTAIDSNDPDVVATTIIHGGSKTSVVTFSGIEESTCSIQGFTIKGGYAQEPAHGGGVRGNGTVARIINCHISENVAYRRGGGLYECDGPIIGCTISNNKVQSLATTEGGGLHNCDGPISGCTIVDNTSNSGMYGTGFGGGLYACNGPITDCTIISNHAGGNGGGLYGCDGTITNCTITDNRAEHYSIQSRGGGLYGCDGLINNCLVSSNWAEESGGGLYDCDGLISDCKITYNNAANFRGGGLSMCESISNCVINSNSADCGGGLYRCNSIYNCLISNNLAVENGGGLHKCGELVNCTVTGNKAKSNGGGIYVQGSSTVINCILWDNASLKGNEIYLDISFVLGARAGPYEFPSEILIRYSNVRGGAAGAYLVKNCTLDWAEGNIYADPLFADPGYWNSNGTPQDTNDDFWVDGDYHLKSQSGRWNESGRRRWIEDDMTSPCIDSGDPNSPIGAEPFPNGGVINMGAYGGTAQASKS